MKKSIILISLLGLIPIACLADSYDNKIAELTRKKQAKMEELDKCAGVKKSLQIAGVSTLGITVAGVATNITEAATLKKKNAEIDSLQKEIDTTNEKINKKKLEIAEKERLAQQQAQRQEQMLRNLKDNNVVSGDTCACDNNSGGDYCSLDNITKTKCMIRACSASDKVPDEKGENCVDKTDDNSMIVQIDGEVIVAEASVVIIEGQDCGANEYIPDNVVSAKKVKNSKGGLTCQLTCSGNMVGVLDYDLEKYKCVADSTNSKIDLSKLTFKQKCEALTGGENGYDGGYFTENGTEYCTPFNQDDESVVQKLCNDLGATKCKIDKEVNRWTCTTGNTCNMFENTYPNIPSNEFRYEFSLDLPYCSQEQLEELSADAGVYENGHCSAITCKNGLPVNDDGTCSLE